MYLLFAEFSTHGHLIFIHAMKQQLSFSACIYCDVDRQDDVILDAAAAGRAVRAERAAGGRVGVAGAAHRARHVARHLVAGRRHRRRRRAPPAVPLPRSVSISLLCHVVVTYC